ATRTEVIVGQFRDGTSVVRVDLRGVEIIDPTAFVRVARSLSRWREEQRGRVMIQFPERSTRASRSSCVMPVRAGLSLHRPGHADIFDAGPERVGVRYLNDSLEGTRRV